MKSYNKSFKMMMRFVLLLQLLSAVCQLSAVSSLARLRLKWTKIKTDNRYPASAVKMDGSIWVQQHCARIMFFHLSIYLSRPGGWGIEDSRQSMTNNQHDGREQLLTRIEHQLYRIRNTYPRQPWVHFCVQKRFRRIPDRSCLQLRWETGGQRGNGVWKGSWCWFWRRN